MFNRLPSGLPKDPVFETTLKGLGYFINAKDEIRSIENPKAYFKYFLTKNARFNDLQREAMNEAIRNIVSDRLKAVSLTILRLPLTATATQLHIPIFVSSNISCASRCIVLFYESSQDLGILAHRLLSGPSGINVGSAVNLVKHIQALPSDPAIILANTGQLCWHRRGKRAVTQTTWNALPAKSAVEVGLRFDEEKNAVPGNRTVQEHVDYIFNHVISSLLSAASTIDIIGVSAGAVAVSTFLNDEKNFATWGNRIEAFASLAPFFNENEINHERFRTFMKQRARVYLVSDEPEGGFVAGPEGNRLVDAYGAPVFSLGEPYYTECLLPKGYRTIITWFEEVANGGKTYINPIFVRNDDNEAEEEVKDWGDERFDYNEPAEMSIQESRIVELAGTHGGKITISHDEDMNVNPADRTVKNRTENPAVKPAEKPAEISTEGKRIVRLVDDLEEKIGVKSTENSGEKSVEKSVKQPVYKKKKPMFELDTEHSEASPSPKPVDDSTTKQVFQPGLGLSDPSSITSSSITSSSIPSSANPIPMLEKKKKKYPTFDLFDPDELPLTAASIEKERLSREKFAENCRRDHNLPPKTEEEQSRETKAFMKTLPRGKGPGCWGIWDRETWNEELEKDRLEVKEKEETDVAEIDA
ncbi:Arb2 domain-containing protein [Calycina marina]|uniref:Arb2 domain-containing protein n=1 Tax=Calycina marina TaxID=1763456 RepID=A0A9P8CCJ0_9HELO|nr:Arb2 domain-containing protein [Calycina marina]